MPAPPYKLLRFIDDQNSEITIYADTIIQYEETNELITTISCIMLGVVKKFVLNIEMKELIEKIHDEPDKFEIIEIKEPPPLTESEMQALEGEV